MLAPRIWEVHVIAFLLLLLVGCPTPSQDDGLGSNGDANNGNNGNNNSNNGNNGNNSSGPLQVGTTPTPNGSFFQNVTQKGPPAGISASQCNDLTDGGPVAAGGCITANIKCGETIVGHTRGGVNKFNTEWYAESTCWPATRNHNGGDERIYKFDVSANGLDHHFYATVWFDTPCEQDVDVTVFRSADRNSCPTGGTRFCDMVNPFKPQNKVRRHYKTRMDPGEMWYILVEGADDKEGPFSVTLDCELE